jgi:hypothetical protein
MRSTRHQPPARPWLAAPPADPHARTLDPCPTAAQISLLLNHGSPVPRALGAQLLASFTRAQGAVDHRLEALEALVPLVSRNAHPVPAAGKLGALDAAARDLQQLQLASLQALREHVLLCARLRCARPTPTHTLHCAATYCPCPAPLLRHLAPLLALAPAAPRCRQGPSGGAGRQPPCCSPAAAPLQLPPSACPSDACPTTWRP